MGIARTRVAIAASVAAALAASAVGCSSTSPRPAIDAVVPDRVTSLDWTPARIEGTDLVNDLAIDLDDRSATIARGWAVSLGAVALDPAAVTYVDPSRIDVVVPAGLAVGRHDVTLVSPGGAVLVLAAGLEVTAEPVGLAISIESAPGGSGAPVGDAALVAGDLLPLHAVVRRRDGAFLADVVATWTIAGGIGALVGTTAPASSVTFEARTVGTGSVAATHAVLAPDATGVVSVAAGPPPELHIVMVVVPPDVVRTQQAIPVDLIVENVSAQAAPITGYWLGFAQGGADVTSQYAVEKDSRNPHEVGPGASSTLRFWVDVSAGAAAGAIDVVGSVQGWLRTTSARTLHAVTAGWVVGTSPPPAAVIAAPAVPGNRLCQGATRRSRPSSVPTPSRGRSRIRPACPGAARRCRPPRASPPRSAPSARSSTSCRSPTAPGSSGSASRWPSRAWARSPSNPSRAPGAAPRPATRRWPRPGAGTRSRARSRSSPPIRVAARTGSGSR